MNVLPGHPQQTPITHLHCVSEGPRTLHTPHHTPALHVRGARTLHTPHHTPALHVRGARILHTLHHTHRWSGGPQESWPDSDAVLSIYVQSKSDSDMKTGTDRKQL